MNWQQLCSLWVTKFCTFTLYRQCVFHPPLTFFLSYHFLKKNNNNNKKATETSHKTFSEQISACRDGTLKNSQTGWKWHHNTSHHPYILCRFANYAHHKIFYMHITLFTPQKSITAHKKTLRTALSI